MAHRTWKFIFNDLSLPEVALSDYKVDFEPIVKADRNANGDMVIEYITEKRKVTVKWGEMRGDMYQKLLLARKGIKGYDAKLTFFDPLINNFVEMNCYASPIGVPIVTFKDNLQLWKDVSISFIEL